MKRRGKGGEEERENREGRRRGEEEREKRRRGRREEEEREERRRGRRRRGRREGREGKGRIDYNFRNEPHVMTYRHT